MHALSSLDMDRRTLERITKCQHEYCSIGAKERTSVECHYGVMLLPTGHKHGRHLPPLVSGLLRVSSVENATKMAFVLTTVVLTVSANITMTHSRH